MAENHGADVLIPIRAEIAVHKIFHLFFNAVSEEALYNMGVYFLHVHSIYVKGTGALPFQVLVIEDLIRLLEITEGKGLIRVIIGPFQIPQPVYNPADSSEIVNLSAGRLPDSFRQL